MPGIPETGFRDSGISGARGYSTQVKAGFNSLFSGQKADSSDDISENPE